MSRPARRLALVATVATLAPMAAVTGSGASAPAAAAAAAPTTPATSATSAGDPVGPRLWTPATATGLLYGKRTLASVPIDLRLVAGDQPIELWSHRTSYAEPITTVLRTAEGDVPLPDGLMSTFGGIDGLVNATVTDARTGTVVMTRSRTGCLNGSTQRARPEAPARSPYPASCYSNPYSLGMVQGVQAGWSNQLLDYGAALRLPRGRYRVTVALRPVVARALGLTPAASSRTVRVAVTRAQHDHDAHDHGHGHGHGRTSAGAGPDPRPAGTTAPTGRRLARADVEGPVPNLRSLPAWGIDVSENGDYLRFSATVWNAGNSPLVVDGFGTDREDRMDAYQYFFDGDGNQTGYAPVGSFEFDHKPTHQHWHFRDFARYSLLRADKTTAVHSRKEAFCLANTDAVDLTVDDADWSPGNTDLSTDCGYEDSLSLRQVLAAGWGDTYAQFRAGQSFDLRSLPNGTYYVATVANPRGRLVESTTDDNTSLRRVVIGGRPGARTVRVPKVGLVVESVHGMGAGPRPSH